MNALLEKPLMPPGASIQFWISVFCCFVFWLVAYGLIIRIGFKHKTFCMPVAAMCANLVWEVIFSQFIPEKFLLIVLGNTAWALFDIAIFITIWKYGRDDFEDPFVRKHFRTIVVIGLIVASLVEYPFAVEYNDVKGYYLGWAAALMMSILFIAMLLRRGSTRGQSFYIALAMFLGNISAYFWVKYYPGSEFSAPINLYFVLTTGFFNLTYVIMMYKKSLEEGKNPWTDFG